MEPQLVEFWFLDDCHGTYLVMGGAEQVAAILEHESANYPIKMLTDNEPQQVIYHLPHTILSFCNAKQ